MSEPVVTLKETAKSLDMIVRQSPAGLGGTIRVPGDKSISHRALMLGAIAGGETIIEGLLVGEDPQSTASCFRAMGADISPLNAAKVNVTGIGSGNLQEPIDVLDAGNSGTTLRLMLGLLAGSPGQYFCVTGDSSLRSRPMSRVVKPLQQMGATIWGRRGDTLAPLSVRGTELQPIHYQSPIASAQVKSCVLLAGLLAEGVTRVTEPAQSRDHTERMLQAFGAQVDIDPDTRTVGVTGKPILRGQRVVVPGDISSAAFWLVAASIVPGSDVVIENVGVNPSRTGILEALAQMGADIERQNERIVAGEPVAELRVKTANLQGCTISGDLIPRAIDEIPILAVAALFTNGTTTIRDAAELRVKESDRLAAIAKELTQLGGIVRELPDGLEIQGGSKLTGTQLSSYGDHRIAMSLAIAALMADGETVIHGADAVSISYPNFVVTLQEVCD
ncbi:MAG: 3-phosphoshikimate 1-carboxyvinyltransferase [Cyanobacteria bacterium P01_H01_bin.15]